MDESLRTNSENDWKIRQGSVLLVEDDAFVREVAAEVLRAAGYRVWVAANAIEAAKMHDEQNGCIDLLLSDMKLPGETGSALAKKLRMRNPRLRVLLATGYGELMEDHLDGDECLAKPFSSAELLRRVKEIMGELTGKGLEIRHSHLLKDPSGGLGQSLCV